MKHCEINKKIQKGFQTNFLRQYILKLDIDSYKQYFVIKVFFGDGSLKSFTLTYAMQPS